VQVTPDAMQPGEIYHTGRVHVWAGRPIADAVLREREVLGEQGVVSCIVSLGSNRHSHDHSVTLSTRGVIDERADADVLSAMRDAASRAVTAWFTMDPSKDRDALAERVRLAVRHCVVQLRGIKPMTIVHVQGASVP